WDTVALDRPERDLWLLDDLTAAARAAYEELTGRTIEPRATAFYRLAWKLADLVSFSRNLRDPHDRNADTEKALWAVQQILSGHEPRPYGADIG
ncbi:MAG: hypothetical protein LBV34_19670, partial [Nocardiopsaceae bacterium]|nr:hypothetical protein [Nocardiopsaceae bacterium]